MAPAIIPRWTFVFVAIAFDANGALLRGPYLQSGSPSNMVVRWRTDVTEIGRVRFGTSAELLSLADEAAAERNWAEAENLYGQATQLATKANDAKRQETVRTRLAQMLYRQALAAEFQTRIERAIRGGHLPAQNAHLSAAAAVGALLESLIGPLASATAEGELEPVEALMLYVLRGLGIPDARARGLVVSRTRENGGETAAQA